MNILFLERYNNYANRIIKTKELFVEDVIANQASESKNTFLLENPNFNPNDGITTEVVIGDTLTTTYPGWKPDYCIVYDPNATVHNQYDNKDYTPFNSCWFVIESKRTRGNQWILTLQRDVIRDNYNTIQDADIYVEKATLNQDDSFIFNSENLDLNQIKRAEYLLKDNTQCQWLVGYVVQDQNKWPQNEQYYTTTYSVPPSGAILTWANIPSYIKNYISLTSGSTGADSSFLANYDSSAPYEVECYLVKEIGSIIGISADNYARLTMSNTGWSATGTQQSHDSYLAAARMGGYLYVDLDINHWPGWNGVQETNNKISENRAYLSEQFRIEHNLSNFADYMSLLSYNGKVIYNGQTGKYYKISVDLVSTEPIEQIYYYNTASNLRSRVRQCFVAGGDVDSNFWYESSTSSNSKYFKYKTEKMTINVKAIEQGSNTINVYLSERRKHIVKEPYDMFCIPYGDFTIRGGQLISKEASLAACRALAQSGLGSAGQTSIVYDIQLLPYCPLQSVIRGSYINESTLTENEDYQYIYGPQGTKLSIMFWCTESDFTFDIPFRMDVENPKMENLCDMYRLCSPNYNGLFEFSVAKNGGISYFNVDCSYKPFQPYIHINPNFGGLYGSDFNDTRGLICGGDFSIAIATNAWEQYKLNNKNYQTIFDREIQKMDQTFTNDFVTNTVKRSNDAILEGYNGVLSRGWFGAADVAHAAINLAADTTHDVIGHNIERNYAKDMFALQNGNVKALPNSLAKTDPFTINNKKWPFLEKYTCTDEEKTALSEKLRLEGMTVGRIGKLTDYLNPTEQRYFKGRLIRDNYIIDDSHMVDAIYSELAKGVYI